MKIPRTWKKLSLMSVTNLAVIPTTVGTCMCVCIKNNLITDPSPLPCPHPSLPPLLHLHLTHPQASQSQLLCPSWIPSVSTLGLLLWWLCTITLPHPSFIDLDELSSSNQLEHVREFNSATLDLSETEDADDQMDDLPLVLMVTNGLPPVPAC